MFIINSLSGLPFVIACSYCWLRPLQSHLLASFPLFILFEIHFQWDETMMSNGVVVNSKGLVPLLKNKACAKSFQNNSLNLCIYSHWLCYQDGYIGPMNVLITSDYVPLSLIPDDFTFMKNWTGKKSTYQDWPVKLPKGRASWSVIRLSTKKKNCQKVL